MGLNGCGVLVGQLSQPADPSTLLRRVVTWLKQLPKIRGLSLQWDLGRKNHFLNIYADTATEVQYVVLHCSLPEARGDTHNGMGHSPADSPLQRQLVRHLKTPHGPLQCFIDEAAEEYRENLLWQGEMALEKRLLIAREIFPEVTVISNMNHMALVDGGLARLGGYTFSEPPGHSVVVTVAPGEEALLVRPKTSVNIFGRGLMTVPHGTGNRMREADTARWDDELNAVILQSRDGIAIYSKISDAVVGYHPEAVLTAAATQLEVRSRLRPVAEFKVAL